MTTLPTSEEAIHLYLLATAYLHDAIIGTPGLNSSLRAREWSGLSFSIWEQVESSAEEKHNASAAPVALCTYKQKTKTWKVKLRSGEELTLLDNGSVWDIPRNGGMIPLSCIPKQQRSRRKKVR
jgi:hypothetical protein